MLKSKECRRVTLSNLFAKRCFRARLTNQSSLQNRSPNLKYPLRVNLSMVMLPSSVLVSRQFDLVWLTNAIPISVLSIARVDPLPQQLEAVYDYFLELPRIRFLLANGLSAILMSASPTCFHLPGGCLPQSKSF
jgi:hypothetical protein